MIASLGFSLSATFYGGNSNKKCDTFYLIFLTQTKKTKTKTKQKIRPSSHFNKLDLRHTTQFAKN